MPKDATPIRGWILLVLALLVSFGFWHWMQRLLIPLSTSSALAEGQPIAGNNSDLYPRWLGAREALLFRRDPYNAETTRKIQIGLYGRVLDPNNPKDPPDQQAFAYPLYVVFVMAPMLSLPFSSVMAGFSWVFLLGTALSVVLWCYAFRLRLSLPMVCAAMILTVSNYPMAQAFYKQQLSLVVALLVAVAAAMVVRGWLGLSGMLLALATIKPQISGLVILWFLIWTLGQWKQRQRLAWSFAGTMAALLAASQALQPGWIRRFLEALREYQKYAGDTPFLQLFLGHVAGLTATVILVVLTLVVFWRWRTSPVGSPRFAWAVALAVTVTLAVINKTAPYNFVLLIPSVLVLAAHHKSASRWSRAAIQAAFATQIWQWLTALALTLLSLVVPQEVLRPAIQAPLYMVFALAPLALLAVLISIPWSGVTPRTPVESRG